MQLCAKLMAKQIFEQYLGRFFIHPLSLEAQLPKANLFVVIPSYKEPELFSTLKSLDQAHQPNTETLVLVVLNNRFEDSDEIKDFTSQLFDELSEFRFQSHRLLFKVIYAKDLEGKNAGVGLARKIGMDAVIHSALQHENNPVMVCLDADCQVSGNYFHTIESQFLNTDSQVAVLEFLHRRPSDLDPKLQSGIDQYELFLEYYRLGLSCAGYPFYEHTVGSSMACKALAYAKSGGMNQRKAGEDFYFLHKLFPFYKTVSLPGPLVFPSPRISDRVPFGTGRFQSGWLTQNEEIYATYHPEVFRLLRLFLKAAFEAIEIDKEIELAHFEDFQGAHPESSQFLINENVLHRLQVVRKSSTQTEIRRKSFLQWFDGLMVLKFVHFFRIFFSDVPVGEACVHLEESLQNTSSGDMRQQIRSLLSHRR